MKNLFRSFHVIFTFFFLTLTCQAWSQPDEKAMRAIRAEFKAINAVKDYEVLELENSAVQNPFPDQGISLKGYYDKDELRKMVLWVGFSHKRQILEYYLKDQSLFFLYTVEEFYHFDMDAGTFNYDSIANKNEWRYYIHKGELIEFIVKGDPPTERPKGAELMAEAKGYAQKLNESRKR
jgi:hypothetical protein